MPESLESVDWGEETLRLTGFAFRRLGRKHRLKDAEDLALEAIAQYLDPRNSPDRSKSLRDVLGSIVNGLVKNLRRKEARWAGPPGDPDDVLEHVAAKTLTPEEAVGFKEKVKRKMDALLDRVATVPEAEQILLLEIEGVDEPSEQAQKLKVDIRDVYRARRKLAGIQDEINEAFDEQEG